ncbi:ArnT family glycosyltransferase [Kutzneria albida]|uniref:Glycosyltransferase RgtA/B/C/D-like domain-containing protein n=1 Tax=Kutzneria albida DSM 43870 TaxID=1449976 RepID=W5W5W6_9PSEU|nr:glycosyltransferase family 39 protein [Kutzneria albida]AHH95886.1 hypothetical protein KALB_2518 [Kutzneria albida DSM 43870]
MGSQEVLISPPSSGGASAPPDQRRARTVSVPHYAWGPVSLVAGGVAVLLLLTAGRWGLSGDELYFLSAGKNYPAWGYPDQPPMLPMLARAMDALFGDSLLGMRLPAIAATLVAVFATAAISREMGGRTRAQVLAALTVATSFQFVQSGHLLATSTIDPPCWALVAWLVVRWVRTRGGWALFGAALVTAFALQVKFLIPIWWLAIAAAALVFGPRNLVTRPALWIGAIVAVAVNGPTLWWQAQHGWPQFEIASSISHLYAGGGRFELLPVTLLSAGVGGALLLLYGLWSLLSSAKLVQYRFLGWAVLATTAFFLVTGGQVYYLAGIYAVCWAAGVTALQHRRDSSGHSIWRWAAVPIYVVGAALVVQSSFADATSPMPAQANAVIDVYEQLPAATREHTVIMPVSHGLAGAVDRYGPQRGVPRSYSGAQGYWYFGAPPESARNVVFVGYKQEMLQRYFTSVQQVGTVPDVGTGDPGDEGKPIWVATGLRTTWADTWPAFRMMKLNVD